MNARDVLTKQEKIVLALVAQGLRTAKIAEELFVSPRTVETHLAHIFEKLGVSTRTEAAIYALRADLIADMEIRRNPEDTFENNRYSDTNMSSDFARSLIRKELA